MKPTEQTVKRLFGTSGNQCAFPGCTNPIIDAKGTVQGRICHIRAAGPNGPRYDATQTDDFGPSTLTIGGKPARSGGFHGGTDLGGSAGHVVESVFSGMLTQLDDNPTFVPPGNNSSGRDARVALGFMLEGVFLNTGTQANYYHLASLANGLQLDRFYNAGTQLGIMGSTGNSTGRHLHFEMILAGKREDPTKTTALPNPYRVRTNALLDLLGAPAIGPTVAFDPDNWLEGRNYWKASLDQYHINLNQLFAEVD